jgi:hypothetical protein
MIGCALCGKINVPVGHRCNDPDEQPVHPVLEVFSAEKREPVKRKLPVDPWANLFNKR